MAKHNLKKPTAKQVGVKKLPEKVRNKMGYLNKGGTMKKSKMMNKGGASMKKKTKYMSKGGASMKKTKYMSRGGAARRK